MKSQAVKLEEKKEKINSAKKILEEKILYAESNLEPNTLRLQQNLEDHIEFIHFAELMKVYEIYKWKTLKSTYSAIKKKTNLDKKVYNQIIRIYADITCYLTEQEATTIANTIRKLQGLNENMMYSYVLLQKKHRDVLNKCKYLIRNQDIAKITEINPQVQPLITKLYENYIDIKIINKKTRILSNAKSNILTEIQRISQSLGQLK